MAVQRAAQLSIEVGDSVTCQKQYQGKVFGISAKTVLDRLHFLSAGTVSFARGMNDTPKIAALLLVIHLVSDISAIAMIGIAIALGGVLSARRVAETMSQKITPMNAGQGFTANLMTSIIVIGASPLGMPVSTTHVSCGALFGLGAVTGKAKWKTITKIFASWVTTLPLGAALGAIAYWVIQRF